MKSLLLITLVATFIVGCAGSPKMNNISLGMTKAEVINVIGNPDSTSAQGAAEYMRYGLWRDFWDRQPGNYSDDYFVRLISGKVESYGRMGDFDSTKTPETKLIIDLNVNK